VVAARGSSAQSLPASVRWLALPLAGLLVFAFFLHRGFPYDRLGGALAARVAGATGAQVRIGELVPRFSLGGPGLEATGVDVTTAGGSRIAIERIFVRPAWSLAWLRANPAVRVDANGSFGEAHGVATLRVPGFRGSLKGIELAGLPLDTALPGALLRGPADLELDLEVGGSGPEGSARFAVGRGLLGFTGLPMQLPFTSFAGELRLGGGSWAELHGASLEGPMISATGGGSLGLAASLLEAPLALDLELTASPGLRPQLATRGVKLGPDGMGRLLLTGTLAQPRLL
jgi:type II secretion system protein N